MSKRFGRNQRRKLRAELADSLDQLSKERAEVRRLLKSDPARDEALRLTARVLGEHFATLPTATMYMRSELAPRLAMASHMSCSPYEAAMPVMEALNIIQLELVEIDCWLDKLRGRLTVYAEYPGNRVALALTRGAFTHWPIEQAARQVAQSLTDGLLRQQDFREFVGL